MTDSNTQRLGATAASQQAYCRPQARGSATAGSSRSSARSSDGPPAGRRSPSPSPAEAGNNLAAARAQDPPGAGQPAQNAAAVAHSEQQPGQTLSVDNILAMFSSTASNQQAMDTQQRQLADQLTVLSNAVSELASRIPQTQPPEVRGEEEAADVAQQDEGLEQRDRRQPRRDAPRQWETTLVPDLAVHVENAEKKFFALQARALSSRKAAAELQLAATQVVVDHRSAQPSRLPKGVPVSVGKIAPKMAGGPQGFEKDDAFIAVQKKANNLTRAFQRDFTKLVAEHKQLCAESYEKSLDSVASGLSERVNQALSGSSVDEHVRDAQTRIANEKLDGAIKFRSAANAAKAEEASRTAEANAANKELAERERLLSTDRNTIEVAVRTEARNAVAQLLPLATAAAAAGGGGEIEIPPEEANEAAITDK